MKTIGSFLSGEILDGREWRESVSYAGATLDDALTSAILANESIVWPSAGGCAFERAVEALAEGRLADAEAAFVEALAAEPGHERASNGLKDVVLARILATRES